MPDSQLDNRQLGVLCFFLGILADSLFFYCFSRKCEDFFRNRRERESLITIERKAYDSFAQISLPQFGTFEALRFQSFRVMLITQLISLLSLNASKRETLTFDVKA